MEAGLFPDDDDLCLDEEQSLTESNSSFKIAREDIKLMNIVRAIAILILLTAAFILSETVFIVTTIAEEKNFEEGYNEAARQLIEGFWSNLDQSFWAARSLATDIAMAVDDVNEEWPFVKVSDFSSRCEGPLYQSKASIVTLDPLLTPGQVEPWEFYAASVYQPGNEDRDDLVLGSDSVKRLSTQRTVDQGIYRFENGQAVSSQKSGEVKEYFPMWQVAPSLENQTSMLVGTFFEETSNVVRQQALQELTNRTGGVLSSFLFEDTAGTDFSDYRSPRSTLYYPVVSTNGQPQVVASIGMEIMWEMFLVNAVDVKFDRALHAVLRNSCTGTVGGGPFTFSVTGPAAIYLGQGDENDLDDDHLGYTPTSTTFDEFVNLLNQHSQFPVDTETACIFTLTVHPSHDFKSGFSTSRPEIFRGVVLGCFFLVIGVFAAYDKCIDQRQNRVVTAAARSDAIVRSLFPSNVRDRLYENAKKKEELKKLNTNAHQKGFMVDTQKNRLKRFMSDGGEEAVSAGLLVGQITEPIADLFPKTTILFADIAGFTAWSSEREPSQVFTLLETVYGYMDRVAKRYGVFKVETVGDCYVAATGVPEQQDNHAEKMVRFARTCCVQVNSLTKSLEQQLGPGTADLSMRFGLHSGPVTAGVLRGQKARFQLFGDTMNMAARMESTGVKGRIQISEATAKILSESGYGHWYVPREDHVYAKGKGELQTYWLNTDNTTSSNVSSEVSDEIEDCEEIFRKDSASPWQGTGLEDVLGKTPITKKLERLVCWNTESLLALLKPIVANRIANVNATKDSPSAPKQAGNRGLVLDEVQMVIPLPEYDVEIATKAAELEVELPDVVKKEMYDYITAIASGYPNNEFHNFEHASHVILSSAKLLKRIMSLDDHQEKGEVLTLHDLYEHTYGIGTDAITHFAVVFSALIHDVGHPGVPNGRLAEEQPDVAEKYQKSFAEQRSVDIAWTLLSLPQFKNLHECICATDEEYARFRMLVVNSVMATDIFDKELKAIRTSRWDQAFHTTRSLESKSLEDMNRKATIVIEHIIQASDVAHTMQHWYIYQKWNERLFREMYTAFVHGRAEKDPSEGWYNGELWFFDSYVIPLAHKLKECGVFGLSSDEYLNYALQNRDEWASKGPEVVETMKRNILMDIAKQDPSKKGLVEESAREAIEVTADGGTVPIDAPTETRTATATLQPGQKVVIAPPGPLGLIIDPTPDGPVVLEVKPESSLAGKVRRKDKLVAIDNVLVSSHSSEAIAALIQATSGHERELTIER